MNSKNIIFFLQNLGEFYKNGSKLFKCSYILYSLDYQSL